MVEQYYTFTLVQRQQDNQFCKSNIILKDEVAKTEHSHPLERFNPFTIEP